MFIKESKMFIKVIECKDQRLYVSQYLANRVLKSFSTISLCSGIELCKRLKLLEFYEYWKKLLFPALFLVLNIVSTFMKIYLRFDHS